MARLVLSRATLVLFQGCNPCLQACFVLSNSHVRHQTKSHSSDGCVCFVFSNTSAAAAALLRCRLFAVGYAARHISSGTQLHRLLSNPPLARALQVPVDSWNPHQLPPEDGSCCSCGLLFRNVKVGPNVDKFGGFPGPCTGQSCMHSGPTAEVTLQCRTERGYHTGWAGCWEYGVVPAAVPGG